MCVQVFAIKDSYFSFAFAIVIRDAFAVSFVLLQQKRFLHRFPHAFAFSIDFYLLDTINFGSESWEWELGVPSVPLVLGASLQRGADFSSFQTAPPPDRRDALIEGMERVSTTQQTPLRFKILESALPNKCDVLARMAHGDASGKYEAWYATSPCQYLEGGRKSTTSWTHSITDRRGGR
jgi:hypothetical protein